LIHSKSRLLKLIAAAFLAERVLNKLPQPAWFVLVFVLVYAVDNIHRVVNKATPQYLDDILLEVTFCAALGALASYLDSQCSIYTGKHGGPAVPALVVVLMVRQWEKYTDCQWR